MSLITARNLEKEYGNQIKTKVIKGIDLTIRENEFVLITGKSGSGKSTLLYLLSGLEPVTQGKVSFRGNSLNGLSDQKMSLLRREDFGFIFQFYNLIPVLTVEENILYPLQLSKKPSREDRAYLDELLEAVEMTDKKNSFPHELSGGQQQRTAIARALITRPAVIFADEPTGNLDTKNEDEVLKILQRITDEKRSTLVMVSHDPAHTRLATRTVELADGRIIKDETVARRRILSTA